MRSLILILSLVFMGCSPNEPTVDARSVLQENKNPKYLVEAHVIFNTPRYYSSDGKEHQEEYRLFGAAGDLEYIKKYLDDYIERYGSIIEWESTKIVEVDVAEISEKIIDRSIPLAGQGVWYFSQVTYQSPNKSIKEDAASGALY